MQKPDFSTTESSIKTLLAYYGYADLRTVAKKNFITAENDKALAVKSFLFLCELYENDVELV